MATFRSGLREREFTEARMKTRSSWIAALFAAPIMIISAACSSASGAIPAAAGPAPEEPDITVAAIPAVDLAGLYIAQDRGLFARQGLHVTIVPMPSSQSVITEQLAGKVDISAGSYVAYLAAQAAGARFRILAAGLHPVARIPGRWWCTAQSRDQHRRPAGGAHDRGQRGQQHRPAADQRAAVRARDLPGPGEVRHRSRAVSR